MSAEERLKRLEKLYVGGVQNGKGQSLSIETLLDVLIVLYDECCNTTLRREKNISEFVEFGKLTVSTQINICMWHAFVSPYLQG